jgi:hypothetical protein
MPQNPYSNPGYGYSAWREPAEMRTLGVSV